MAKNGPAEAAKIIIAKFDPSSEPIHTEKLLEKIIVQERWSEKALTYEELVKKWHGGFTARLKKYYAEAIDGRAPPPFEFNDVNVDFIQGACFIAKTDHPDIVDEKKNRRRSTSYFDSFVKLTDTEFEYLCGRILYLLKVEKPFVSKVSSDQGIDFFGRVPYGSIIKPTSLVSGAEIQLKIWLVGQAKNYRKSQVSTKEIRELVGSVSLAKSKTYAGSIDPLTEL